MAPDGPSNQDASASVAWRTRLGVAMFVVGFAAPAAIPLVAASSMPAGLKTALSAVLAVGVPEVMMLAAAAVMGKEGFAAMKSRIGRWLKRHGPPATVSRTRYRIGLVLFVLPIALAFIGPYWGSHLPGYKTTPLWWHIGGDVMFLTSLVVLGGDFWDKLRALFVHEARINFGDVP